MTLVPLPANNLHPVFGPLLALLVLGVLAGLLRWTYGTQADHPAPERDPDGDYGLLRQIAVAPTAGAAATLRRRLADAGIRATVNPSPGGHRVLVFARDAADARVVLTGHG